MWHPNFTFNHVCQQLLTVLHSVSFSSPFQNTDLYIQVVLIVPHHYCKWCSLSCVYKWVLMTGAIKGKLWPDYYFLITQTGLRKAGYDHNYFIRGIYSPKQLITSCPETCWKVSISLSFIKDALLGSLRLRINCTLSNKSEYNWKEEKQCNKFLTELFSS